MIDVSSTIEILRTRTIETQSSVSFDGTYLVPGSLVNDPNPDMSLLDAVITRRTSRNYADEPVPFELFESIVNLAAHAPSACNEQRWKIIYIDDPATLEDLYQRGSAAFLRKTKQAFLVLYNNQSDNVKYRDHVQSGAAFITTFSLLAHAVGIGSCWIGHIPNRREIRRLFQIDRRFDPIALVSFGFYKYRVKPRPRKKQGDALVAPARFNFGELVFQTNKNITARRLLIRAYYALPVFIRRRIRHWTLPYEKKFYDEVAD